MLKNKEQDIKKGDDWMSYSSPDITRLNIAYSLRSKGLGKSITRLRQEWPVSHKYRNQLGNKGPARQRFEAHL